MDEIDIEGINQGELLAALYNNAKPVGLGWLHVDAATMTAEEAWEIINSGGESAHLRASGFVVLDGGADWRVDYVKGRPIKVSVKDNTLRKAWLYDRDHGEGACARVVAELRAKAQR
jgi:hypothetical protein